MAWAFLPLQEALEPVPVLLPGVRVHLWRMRHRGESRCARCTVAWRTTHNAPIIRSSDREIAIPPSALAAGTASQDAANGAFASDANYAATTISVSAIAAGRGIDVVAFAIPN